MRFLLLSVLTFGAAVIVVGICRGDNTLGQFFDMRSSHLVLNERVQKLESENTHLADEISKLKTSATYAKRVLRDKYHLTDSDERMIFFAD